MRILWTGVAALALTMPAAAQSLGDQVQQQMPSLMTIYKDLHANPELSFMEVRSAGILATEARKLGFDVTEKVGGTGVVAVMKNGPGPVVLVRADMDGLPVTEQTGLPGASKVRVTTKEGVETGVMHACGHDTHMTSWIGTARLMAANKDKWSGTLVMIGQPAEERGAGARMMLEDGLYTRFPKPQYALAFHDAAQFPAGAIGYTPGYALANVDSVDILVKGVGGHGAYPQATKDPIVLASRIVTALQTLVSREISPLDSAVVTVGSFHAGAKHNIIPDEARLQLTVRSYTDEVRNHLLDGIARVAKGEAIAAGLPDDKLPVVSVEKDEFTPSTFNTPDFTEDMAAFLTTRFGDKRVIKMPPVMGGEDFGRFSRDDKDIKSLIIWVGGVPQAELDAAKKEGRTLPSLHSPFWAPDAPAVISTATEALTSMAMKLMPKG
ncbi:amidohydrolase [Sphingopyxis terrae]|jgi:hippurate hydrolase|uniref:Hippurate hydrolase n=1 Tax=Sphingopyxis terrae subsp. ummariensis TaxID=429001 RepID=A0A1Y6FTY2_9SPHN|nr:amidohydrolase [Sphingopyxis terrae]OJW27013.1 MAG: peptidase M20 [Sphingopyxis sp. 65-8]MBN8805203.1 amidohydrolase [Sphingopyxis terrae]PCF90813.1 amidohydrolase [Sphingopyxis terrae subsp. ummariensis]SMQ79020.1 hippurate hydrolase [Sphingopyxis terrae subsp. ummariensis]HRE34766.1 amidohydrolase [Sphingopyxis terrae]